MADLHDNADIQPIRWKDDHLVLLDQTRLPHAEVWIDIRSYVEAIEAIKTMKVRGAPAIGVTAAYAMALAATEIDAATTPLFLNELHAIAAKVASARPTAVNLGWAVQRSLDEARRCLSPSEARERLLRLADKMRADDIGANRALAELGAKLLPNGGVLTHCNTGALATAGQGTALGVIRTAFAAGKPIHVICTETRPWLQGARLTAWELERIGVPAELIVDSAAAHMMSQGEVQSVIVGADRVAANGDVANKIGTYALAVLAQAHGIPFYVAAPCSSVDIGIASGAEIEIEERDQDEVKTVAGNRIAADIAARNPAFDITPASLITAIITERGVVKPPFERELRELTLMSRAMEGAA